MNGFTRRRTVEMTHVVPISRWTYGRKGDEGAVVVMVEVEVEVDVGERQRG
jgi:hypothetical protein